MNSTDWDKIRAHWKRLLAVDTNSLIAYLFKVNVLTDIEHEKAKKFPVSAERMEYILQQIKKKPKKDGAFEHFINALRKDKASVGLADSIMKVESRSDPLVCSKPDPHLLDEVVNTYLHDNFTNMNGKCTKVSEVKEMLLGAQIFTSENTWDDEILIEFIQKMFTNVTVEQQWSHLEDTNKDKRGSINIESTETTGIAEMMQEKEIKCMSIPELNFFLKTNGIPDDVLAILEKEEISDEIFLSMKEEELKSVFPNASFGVRKKLHLLASKANIPMVKFKKDYLRNFDTRVSHLSKYTKGNRVDVSVHLGGKKTDPIRNFHLVEDTDQDKALELIGSKFIAFISACLNDRQNGTIYFGINPENGEILGVDISKDDLKTVFQRSMKASFIENVMGVIHKAVREAEFIPLIFSGPERFVVEIDVIPNTIIMQQENIIWTKTKALLSKFKKAHKQNKSVVFRFSKKGIPCFLSLEEFNVFEKSIKNIVLERKEEEMTTPFKTQENLRQKFLNLYTAGKEKLEEELFPFLLTSPQDENMKSEESLHLVSLIQDLHPEVLFDFENFSVSTGLLNTMEEKNSGVTRTFSINDFGDHVKPQDYRHFIATLHDESRSSIPWMLSNGDDKTSMDALKWNKTMRTTYQKALNHFIKIVNKDRIIVFMLLLSKNYSTMIEACEEVLAHLPDKWILLAEN